MNRAETTKILAQLREYYPSGKEVTNKTVDAWHEVLRPYDFRELKGCIGGVIAKWSGYTMPPPGMFIRAVEEIYNERHAKIREERRHEYEKLKELHKARYRCPICKDSGIIVEKMPDGNEYERPCECEAGQRFIRCNTQKSAEAE